jgi:hypothetical protein
MGRRLIKERKTKLEGCQKKAEAECLMDLGFFIFFGVYFPYLACENLLFGV